MAEARITQAGVYVEIDYQLEQVRVTQAGTYVEVTPPWPPVQIWYDGVEVTEYVHTFSLEAAINQWAATTFASSAAESGSGLAKWRLPMQGHWAPEWDGAVMPDTVTADERRDVVVMLSNGTRAIRIVYYWATGGAIKQTAINADTNSAIEWDWELVLSGAPYRFID